MWGRKSESEETVSLNEGGNGVSQRRVGPRGHGRAGPDREAEGEERRQLVSPWPSHRPWWRLETVLENWGRREPVGSDVPGLVRDSEGESF